VSADVALEDLVHVMGSADLFCRDGSYVTLEQDWRRGLGWWLVRGNERQRISVSEAIRSVPAEVAHEVLVEAALLVPVLELDRSLWQPPEPGLADAVHRLRDEVLTARAAYRAEPRVVAPRVADLVA
jgi:hypothetical protein